MDAEDRKEQRKYERFPFIDDVLVDGTKQCTSADISEGGLYISAMQAFEENTVIDVTILIKGENITVKANVRHCQPGIGLGIMFVDLTDEQKVKIKEVMKDLASKSIENQ
jgi:hypothetical protein